MDAEVATKICVVCLQEMPAFELARPEVFDQSSGSRRHIACEGKPLPIKIFRMNDCDWMAARNLEEAKASYLKDFCGELDEDEAFDDPAEISAEDLDRFRFHDDDRRVTTTFRCQLERMIAREQSFPAFFASSEC